MVDRGASVIGTSRTVHSFDWVGLGELHRGVDFRKSISVTPLADLLPLHVVGYIMHSIYRDSFEADQTGGYLTPSPNNPSARQPSPVDPGADDRKMAPGISYDDSGSLASYFGVTVLAFILIPSTYYTLLPSKRNAPKPLTPYPGHIQQTHPSAQISRSTSSRVKRLALLALGYAVLAFLCLRIVNAPPSTGGTVYNPFEILGLSDSSTEKQIKKHYKKLSLQL